MSLSLQAEHEAVKRNTFGAMYIVDSVLAEAKWVAMIVVLILKHLSALKNHTLI